MEIIQIKEELIREIAKEVEKKICLKIEELEKKLEKAAYKNIKLSILLIPLFRLVLKKT